MSNEQFEHLQKKYNHLFERVRRMRAYQKEYFKYRASSDLKLSKQFEKEVDQLIATEVKEQKSKQKEIF